MITEYGSGQKESGIIVLFLGEILAVAFGRALQVMLFTGMFVLWEIWKLIMIVKAFMLPREQADEFMEEAIDGNFGCVSEELPKGETEKLAHKKEYIINKQAVVCSMGFEERAKNIASISPINHQNLCIGRLERNMAFSRNGVY
jgi:hypothetical protein